MNLQSMNVLQIKDIINHYMIISAESECSVRNLKDKVYYQC